MKYVEVKLKRGERTSEAMVVAALISDSPVVSWHISPLAVQWTSGKSTERPGTVMLFARRSNSGIPYQISASGELFEMD
jgi:hypothetical protein